jgi:hypothetical protein
MISGRVNRVMRLLHAVSVTERATSPLANIEKTLLELPPGLQATSMIPMMKRGTPPAPLSKGEKGKRCIIPQAIKGSRMIWPTSPTSTGMGRCAMSRKSCGRSVSPKSNIRTVSIGSTINIAFIGLNYYQDNY